MHVKPADGRKVMDPRTKRHIPAEGIRVSERDTYWVRRLRAGDVVFEVAVPAASVPASIKSEVQKAMKPHKSEV
jgi:hypothetical protein